MNKTVYYIPKMDCPTEEKLIRSRFQSVTGIKSLEINFITRELTVTYDGLESDDIKRILIEIEMEPIEKDFSYTEQEVKTLQPMVKFWDWFILCIAGLLAATAETIALILNNEASLLVIGLAIAAMFMSGRETFIKGIKSIRYFTLNMNFLMTIAVVGAIIIGEWPEAAMVTVLFSLAEVIESYALDKARRAISKLMEITPDSATVKTPEGEWQKKPIQTIQINDIVLVKPGERIPIDGTIVKGRSSVNQAPITGESMPVEKEEHDPVFAGSINERGSFEFKVTAQMNDTVIAKIVKAVQQAQSNRAPSQRFVDEFAKYYTPTMVILAILIATVPPLLMGAAFYPWFYKALVLLVIACPCALVISTPVTIVSGLAAAAKHGLLIKGGTYLEKGSKLKAIGFDKTGTLTHGKPQVTDIIPLSQISEKEALILAVTLEVYSEHPVAEAFVQKWKDLNTKDTLLSVTNFQAIAGRGVIGTINERNYFLGNHRFAKEKKVYTQAVEDALQRLEQQGKTLIILGDDKEALAIFAVIDTIRETSVEAIQSLHQLGIQTALITGDNPVTANLIGKTLGIDDVRANLLPEDKLGIIDQLTEKYGSVGMVGDGINDAPALAKASIGFAMGRGGTDIALETADVVLMESNLTKIPFFIGLSRRTRRKLFENISLSIGVKITFFVLALLGLTTLWMAVFADMGVSLIVVFNGLRLLRFK